MRLKLQLNASSACLILAVSHPTSGPTLFGLRRWPIQGFEKHLIFYLVFENTIDIVRVLHSARDIEGILEEEP